MKKIEKRIKKDYQLALDLMRYGQLRRNVFRRVDRGRCEDDKARLG